MSNIKDGEDGGLNAHDIALMEDYNARYEQDFTIPTHARFKKDIAARLAHKEPYIRIERSPEKRKIF